MEGTDEIFVLDQSKRELRSIPLRRFHLGLFGTSLEDALQKLLETPGIIPGSQIDPSSDDPPRFALLRREMPIGGWSLDHLFVDQTGTLTLVEAKLLQNPQSRREVIGQVVEYAANASDAWAFDVVRQHADEFWSRRGRKLDDILSDAFPGMDLNQLWRKVELRLGEGRVRLIIAADTIRPEVRRMIEYLNSEMINAEVLGLELRVYAEDQHTDQIILAPRIVGQATSVTLPSSERAGIWNAAKLRETFRDLPDHIGGPLIALLDWAVTNDCFLSSRAISPTFGLAGRAGDRIFSVYSSGTLYLHFEEFKYPSGLAERDQLLDDLRRLRMISPDLDPTTVVDGRNLTRDLSDVYQHHEFEALLNILARYCRVSDDSV